MHSEDPISGDSLIGSERGRHGVFYAAVITSRINNPVVLSEVSTGAGPDGLPEKAVAIARSEIERNPGLGSFKSIGCMGMPQCAGWYRVDGGILYVGVVDDSAFESRRAVAFLESISSTFKVKFQGQGGSSNTREFDSELRRQMEYWGDSRNSVSKSDARLDAKLAGLKHSAIESIASQMERQDKIEIVAEQSEVMSSHDKPC
eukprot:TRINITY_DN7677_c0_g1_i2.p1 TRINITY_DN7677_c0_g1~~TRINITY_DN7677_c0_g1_i2.p1  ORF type:complete len:203 (+),score=41.55 TRINITY_DN7677_c0_g1_i2:139-747(+)